EEWPCQLPAARWRRGEQLRPDLRDRRSEFAQSFLLKASAICRCCCRMGERRLRPDNVAFCASRPTGPCFCCSSCHFGCTTESLRRKRGNRLRNRVRRRWIISQSVSQL